MRLSLPSRFAWPLAFVGVMLVNVILLKQRQSVQQAYHDSEQTVSRLTVALLAQAAFEPVAMLPADASTGVNAAKAFSLASCLSQSQSPCADVATKVDVPGAAAGAAGASLRDRLTPSGSAAYTLVVLFSPTDCPVCLQEAAVWEELHKELGARLS